MRTPIQLIPSLALPLRRLRKPSGWFACMAIAALAAIEVLGRQTTTELHDGMALLAVAVLITLGYCIHGENAFAWAKPAWRSVRGACSWLTRRRFDMGIDLRESPPVPSKSPPLVRTTLIALTGVVTMLSGLAAFGGFEYRAIAVSTFYTGYLAGLLALWTALLFVMAASILLPAVCIHDAFVSRYTRTGPRPRGWERIAIGAYFGFAVAAAVLLPTWMPVVLCAIGLSVFVVAMTVGSSSITLLWRHRGDDEVHSLRWQTYETLCGSILALAFLSILLLSLGREALGAAGPGLEGNTPITWVLGVGAAWLGCMALCLGAVFATCWVSRQRRRDPARPSPTVLWVGGIESDRAHLAELFAQRNWRARFAPEAPKPTDVPIEMVESPMPPLGSSPHRWPMRVSMRGLKVPELQQLLGRRDEVQRRRTLVRGFEKLFKRASEQSFRRGNGFWLAPQYWFLSGMTRDVDDEDYDAERGSILSGTVGPAYHRVFAHNARHHIWAILRALQVDLIFIEDGVGFRSFRRVLRVLFEHYDIHGANLRVEDRHFRGLPKTRVIVHDYELGNPLRKKGYPEPDYETLGRARILHVFKDHGEYEAPIEDPIDLEGAPVPMAPMLPSQPLAPAGVA